MPRTSLVTRINDLDLTRATEQTALYMKLLSRKGLLKKHDAEKHALCATLGFLGHSYCDGSLVYKDRSYVEPRHQPLWDALGKKFGRAGAESEMKLHLAVSPMDGLRSYTGGRNGVVSVLAGGPAGCFLDLSETRKYLVVTARAGALADEGTLPQVALGDDPRNPRNTSPTGLGEVFDFVESLARKLSERGIVSFATATNERDFADRKLRVALGGGGKDRYQGRGAKVPVIAYEGSSIAAALCSFFDGLGIDAFVGIARKTHAVMMAIGAQATGGELLAFPLIGEREASPQSENYTFVDRAHVLTQDGFVSPEQDCFLVATGVNESALLKGARLRDGRLATTHSLCIRSKTRSSRFIEHRHHLDIKPFRFLDRESHEASFPDGEEIESDKEWITTGRKELNSLRIELDYLREIVGSWQYVGPPPGSSGRCTLEANGRFEYHGVDVWGLRPPESPDATTRGDWRTEKGRLILRPDGREEGGNVGSYSIAESNMTIEPRRGTEQLWERRE